MKSLNTIILIALALNVFNCNKDNDVAINPSTPTPEETINTNVNFQHKTTIQVGGEGASEITAYDAQTKKIFTVNVESNQIVVNNISDLDVPVTETPIDVSSYGTPNSVAVSNGKLAVALEAPVKQDLGKIVVFNTTNHSLISEYTVGALPDMVTFTKDGNLIISANEGEPNADYTVDPEGSISIIDLEDDAVVTLGFNAFESQLTGLEAEGFRVFGPNASLSQDVEPEYITVSNDSKTAWVSLQENNGIAKVNLETKIIEAIYPLGYKDFNLAENTLDASDDDDEKVLRNWPVKGIYQPDGITSVEIVGTTYIISANEGDSRDYDGFSEEERVKDLDLDEMAFPISEDYKNVINLGRLKVTTTLGDTDNDNDFDELYTYGARSFSIWSADGNLVYDSGNSIATETLNATPDRFNDDDNRSDDKGAEPENVDVLNIGNQRYILFVGLERNDQVMVYDITNPAAPEFLDILSHDGDEAPEGLLVIPAADSPNGKDLLVVSNEDSGTISFYENVQ